MADVKGKKSGGRKAIDQKRDNLNLQKKRLKLCKMC